MGVWLPRALITYLIVWAFYFALAMYLQRSAGGPPGSQPTATFTLLQTALWPYVFWRLWYAPDYASAIGGDTFSDKKR